MRRRYHLEHRSRAGAGSRSTQGRRGGDGRTLDGDRAGVAQCRRCGTQGGTRSDDVVDNQHAPAVGRRTDAIRRPVQAFDPGHTGLWGCGPAAIEQAAAWDTELASHMASDEFSLIEPAVVPTITTGGRPGDDVDRTSVDIVTEQAIDQ